MPWDVTRVRTNPEAIETHLTDFAAGVTSIDEVEIAEAGTDYYNVVIQYTA